MEREVVLQVLAKGDAPVLVAGDEAGVHQGTVHVTCRACEGALLAPRFVAVVDESCHRATARPTSRQYVYYHPVRDIEARHQRFRSGRNETFECLLVPSNIASFRRLAAHNTLELHRVAASFRFEASVLYHMLGRLNHDAALSIKATSPSSPRDLVKVACLQ